MDLQPFAIALVALGGALGGIARYYVSAAVARRLGATYPYGTLAVNASGALLIGVLAALVSGDATAQTSGAIWLLAAVGALGSYTTVSSFALQALVLWRARARGAAAGYVVVSVAACAALVALGYHGGSRLGGAM